MAQNSTSEVLGAIRTAEKEADEVRENAAALARQMIAEASAKAENDFESAAADCAAEKKEALADIRARAERLVIESADAVRADADKLCRDAEKLKRDTVDIIFWEISRKCQQA